MKRGSFLSVALVAGVPGGVELVEPRNAFEQNQFNAAVGKPAQIRQLWENVALKPGVFANIKNSLNGLQFGYGYPASGIAMAVVNHGPSAAYTYDDSIWTKYRISDFVGLAQKESKNPFFMRKSAPSGPNDPNDEDSAYQDFSIAALQSRGVVFLTCHTAVMEQSRSLVKGGYAPAQMTPKDIAEDILTHLVPGAMVIPSGVATVAVLQKRFGYVYTTIQ